MSSYDLTQINLNSAGNVVASPTQANTSTNAGRANFSGGGGNFKVHIEF